MDTFWTWILSVLVSSAGGAALIAIVAYLGRSQLSHWLSKDLEAQKAAHQRDLEAYKVSLIAEAEKVKASRDVQKAMAVRMAEKRFSAIDNLHQKLISRATETLSTIHVHKASDQASRAKARNDLVDKAHIASAAVSLASPFLTIEEEVALHNFMAALADAAGRLNEEAFTMTADEYAQLKGKLIAMQIECDSFLKAHISRMLNMS